MDALCPLLTRSFADALVESCTSAELALDRVATEDFDVVVSDVRMPGTDGLTLLQRAHELSPSTPIVFVTGVDDDDLAMRALRAGAFDVLTKPVDPRRLFVCMTRALRAHESAHELEAQRDALATRAAELARTVEEQTRDLREANRVKDEFLATVSRELRTPLTSVLGWSRLMLRGELEAPIQREALESIERNAAYQARLVEDLLDVSWIMTGKMSLLLAPVPLGHVVTTVIDAFAPTLRRRNITLIGRVALADVQVDGDRDRLKQVITNLLSNAVKFTSDGGTIDVALCREGDHVRFAVSDDGVGIGPAFLPTIFERFHERDGSGARPCTGLGLGLAIVKHLVELHNGAVECSSSGEGHGATFTVRLPASEALRAFPDERSGTRGLHTLVDQADDSPKQHNASKR